MIFCISKLMKTLIILTLVGLSLSQSCISKSGQNVDWWIVMKSPGAKNGFGYIDAQMEAAGVDFIQVIGNLSFIQEGHAVHSTMKQINDQQLQHVAWSDQPPGTDPSSTFAHSKGFIAFSLATQQGFIMDHSLPRFPEFFPNMTVNLTNANNSNTYGQHLFCMTLDLAELESIA